MKKIEARTVLTIKELMKELKVGRSTAYKLTRTKGFPVARAGKTILIPYAKLLEWLENGGNPDV